MRAWKPTRLERTLWLGLMDSVIDASARNDDESVRRLFCVIGRALGSAAALAALLALTERCAAPMRAEIERGAFAFAGFAIEDEHGNEMDVEAAPYALRWAGRMVAAAANGDEETQFALIAAALDDAQLGPCVAALAHMAASSPEVRG